MCGPSSANSFMKRRTSSMANASNVEFEGHEHMRKPYDRMCFCGLAVVPLKLKTKTNPRIVEFETSVIDWQSKKADYSYFQWMDETHDDVIGVTEFSTNNKNVEIYEARLNRRGTWDLLSTFSGEELLTKEHMRSVEKLLILTIILVVVGLFMSLITLIR
ncbi:hypothetical protein PIB30_103438 [Stylosanthes scabra]|uniref:Uncharacterized protein n=1 Tax=Stylosanthes scabra TaxID=79078 RepID=A0ABU6TXM3_9FABA|nr:hypothetical protein [Stylosanthes scabra]